MFNRHCVALAKIAKYLDAELQGDPAFNVTALAPLPTASKACISFLSQQQYLPSLADTQAGAVILKPEWANQFAGNKLLVSDPYLAYARVSQLFESLSILSAGIHETAVVAETAQIAASASIGANCVIGERVSIGEDTMVYPGVVIGDNTTLGHNCLLHANVTLYHNVHLGKRCIVHSGTVIGSDGFGFAPDKGGWEKIHQLGGVRIGNDVEIGSNTSIDRGALQDTVIEDGVIIDNLVHIAHNVTIGGGSAIAGCVGIAGSTTLGKRCTVAGAVAINGHISIADDSHFHGGTIVTKGNDQAGVFASAPPLQEVKRWRRNSVRYSQLDDLVSRVKVLEKLLKNKKQGSN